MARMELISKISMKRVIEEIVRAIVLLLVIIVACKFLGLGPLLRLTGSPRPELFAFVNCESWKIPWCVDKGVKRPKSIVHPNDIKRVLSAESMYTIKVLNKGDREATNPNLTIEDNLYSEVIRSNDPNAPEEHFMPGSIELGPIQVGKTAAVDVKAWISRQPSRRRARKNVEIRCEATPATLYMQGPCRRVTCWVDNHFLCVTVILTFLLLLLFFALIILIRGLRRNTHTNNKERPE